MQIRRQALLTLIGVMFVKISSGILSDYGSLNLYILSYFHSVGTEITSSTNSLIILAVIVPISIIVLFATKISNKIGYQTTIRISAIIFLISPQLIRYSFTIQMFTFFCVFMPATMFAISSIAILNCLWTQFPDMKHKATAIAVFCYGLGSILWNFLFTFYVNPSNLQTIIQNQHGIKFFGEQVVKNVYPAISNGYLLCGILFVIGSFLIRKNYNEQVLLEMQRIRQNNNDTQLVEYEEKLQLNQIESVGRQSENIIKTVKNIRNSLQNSKNNNELQLQQYKQERREQFLTPDSQQSIELVKILLGRKFVYIFLISLFSGMYQIFLLLNLKLIYMPIVQDDHFLVYCAMAHAAIGIFSSFFWGYIGDRIGFHKAQLIFVIADLIIKVYGSFSTTKTTIFIMFVLLGLSDKGMMTIMGPGLVQIFGLKTATQLLPYKGLSIFLGFLLSPILFVVMGSFITELGFLKFSLVYSVICVYLAYKLPSIQ